MEEHSGILIIKNRRSLFTFTVVEIVSAILVSLVTLFGLNKYLQSILPFPCGGSVGNISIDCGWTREQAWNTLGRPLFETFAIPLTLSLALATVFLIRSIRHDVLHFSRMGNFALSWPLFSFLGLHYFYVFGLCILPIGLVVAILATIHSGEERNNKLDWISLLLCLVWIVICGLYFGGLWSAYGD